MNFVMDSRRANPVETPDGELTKRGMDVAHDYATAWVDQNTRDLNLERFFPELDGLFYDTRVDPGLARVHAIPSIDLTPVIPIL